MSGESVPFELVSYSRPLGFGATAETVWYYPRKKKVFLTMFWFSDQCTAVLPYTFISPSFSGYTQSQYLSPGTRCCSRHFKHTVQDLFHLWGKAKLQGTTRSAQQFSWIVSEETVWRHRPWTQSSSLCSQAVWRKRNTISSKGPKFYKHWSCPTQSYPLWLEIARRARTS